MSGAVYLGYGFSKNSKPFDRECMVFAVRVLRILILTGDFINTAQWAMLCSSSISSSSVRLFQKPSGNNGVAKAIRYYMAWQSRRAKRQIMRPSPSSSAEEIVDHGQRARVAALDGAGLPALRALQPLPGPARPQRPAPPRQDPQSPSCMSTTPKQNPPLTQKVRWQI